MPNVVVEFGAVIAELGEQPRAARQFSKNTGTVFYLVGAVWVPEEICHLLPRIETNDEYFPYHKVPRILAYVWHRAARCYSKKYIKRFAYHSPTLINPQIPGMVKM